jgi:D-alanyl-D-alanine carboxypeptidase/D-alanyl-D-alanine-endopeptidase (penicillin-binding protein 4)
VRAACLLVAITLTGGACAAKAPAVSPAAPGVASRPSEAVSQLRRDLAAVFGAPIMAHAQWAVDVRSLRTGEPLFDLNADKLVMPASNMKVLTLAAAAEVLGWDARFTTTLETAGSIQDGVLYGDLIVRGGGDPTLNMRGGRAGAVLDEWARALRAAGVHAIHGRIVGDDGAFDDEGLGGGWAWDYLQYGYAAPVGALQYNEDVAELIVAPGAVPGAPAIVRLAPGSGLTLVNRATTGAADSTGTIDYRRHLDRPILEVTGSLPVGALALIRSAAVVNPTAFFAESLKRALMARGIQVKGEAIDGDDSAEALAPHSPQSRRVLASTPSPPLREIAAVLMKVSHNLYAETLLKAAGAAAGAVGTTEGGRQAAREVFTKWGIVSSSYVMVDGSGLSRYNYVTAGTLTKILEHLYRDERHRDPFVATLPVAGKDGTLANRMRKTRAEGNAAAKTGTIANVRSLSGYVTTRDGEPLAFAILANDFVVPAATVNWIADLAVEVLANFRR